MRLSKLLCLAGLALMAASASAQTLQDERPNSEDAGPAGIACVYPLGSTDNTTACDFMVYVQESKQNAYGSLVLLTGNMPNRTEVVSVRVLSHIENGELGSAAAIATGMLVIALAVLATLDLVQRKAARHDS